MYKAQKQSLPCLPLPRPFLRFFEPIVSCLCLISILIQTNDPPPTMPCSFLYCFSMTLIKVHTNCACARVHLRVFTCAGVKGVLAPVRCLATSPVARIVHGCLKLVEPPPSLGNKQLDFTLHKSRKESNSL